MYYTEPDTYMDRVDLIESLTPLSDQEFVELQLEFMDDLDVEIHWDNAA